MAKSISIVEFNEDAIAYAFEMYCKEHLKGVRLDRDESGKIGFHYRTTQTRFEDFRNGFRLAQILVQQSEIPQNLLVKGNWDICPEVLDDIKKRLPINERLGFVERLPLNHIDNGPYLPGHKPRKKSNKRSPDELSAIRKRAWATRRAKS